MAKQVDTNEIKKIYDEIQADYGNIIDNQERIGSLLADFVINGTSVGYGVYNEINGLGKDLVQIPEEGEVESMINKIRTDAGDIASLKEKVDKLISLCEESRGSQHDKEKWF